MNGQLSPHWPESFLKGEDHTWLDLPEPTPRCQRRTKTPVLCVVCRVPSPVKFCPTIFSQAKWEKVYEPGKCSAQFLAHRSEESQLKTRTRSSAAQDSCEPYARLMPPQMRKGTEGLKSHSRTKEQRQGFNPNRFLNPFTCCCDKKPVPNLSVDAAEWNPVPLRPYPAHRDLLLLLFCLPQQGWYGLLLSCLT